MVKTVSGLEHFARIAAPQRWREVLIQMLTICLDGSPKEADEYRVIVVAGFASFAGVWDEFEQLWSARLNRDRLPYFHAGDFAQSVGVFDGWRNDEPKRRALIRDLLGIIEGCGLRKFGCAMRIKDHQNASDCAARALGFKAPLDAFTNTAMSCVEDFHAFARGEGIIRNVRYVFEKGDPEDVLRKLFRHYGFRDPDFSWSKPRTDRKGFLHDPFIGLQAAGWIAYEYYLDFDRMLHGERTSDRWGLRAFERLPGFLTIKHQGSLLPDLGAMNRGFGKSLQKVARAADRLEVVRSTARGKRKKPGSSKG